MQFASQSYANTEPARTHFMENMREQGKLQYDFHKHFTTLGTGSILFIATVVRIIFPKVPETDAISLLILSLSLLAVSVVASALAMKGNIYGSLLGRSSRATNIIAEASCFLELAYSPS